MTIRIINRSNNPLPAYATEGSSGMDIRAYLQAAVEIKPMERKLISTGLFLEIPEGFEAQVRPRSGLAAKQGITCLNTPGTIDSDYRGEVKVILINLDTQPHTIQSGERIAQMVFQKVEKVNWELSQEIDHTTRSAGGFGSTGKQ